MTSLASERVKFQISPELKEELETAAAMLGLTTSAFVKDAAMKAARETLRQDTAAVDRPGEHVGGLAELLRRPSVFARD